LEIGPGTDAATASKAHWLPRKFKPLRFGQATLAFLLPLAVACSSERSTETSIERDARVLRAFTVPPAAQNLDVSSVERVNSTVRVSWEFETTWSWEQYSRWAADHLKRQSHFTQGPGGRESLDFIKELPGDTYAIRIELAKPGPPLSIRVIFRAWAS
jgi:hypothetical protein